MPHSQGLSNNPYPGSNRPNPTLNNEINLIYCTYFLAWEEQKCLVFSTPPPPNPPRVLWKGTYSTHNQYSLKASGMGKASQKWDLLIHVGLAAAPRSRCGECHLTATLLFPHLLTPTLSAARLLAASERHVAGWLTSLHICFLKF